MPFGQCPLEEEKVQSPEANLEEPALYILMMMLQG